MALPPLATVDALEEWLGLAEPLEGADATRAGAYLSVASMLVRSVTRRAWLTDDEPVALDDLEPAITEDDLAIVSSIVVQAAERKWRNPSGVVQETKGPFSSSYGPAAASGIYLTDIEEAQLASFGSQPAKLKLGVLSTTRGDCLETNWVDVYPPGQALPVDYP